MKSADALEHVARLHGVETSYEDNEGELRRPSVDALVAVLAALGAPMSHLDDAPEALEATRAERAGRMLEPTLVAWDGLLPSVPLRLDGIGAASAQVTIELEDGDSIERTVAAEPDADPRLVLDERVPYGAHRLHVEIGARTASATVLAAPTRLSVGSGRTWGLATPLYAVRTARTRGVGDLADLRLVADWAHELGGQAVACLPLLATYSGDEHHDPSPYAPVSRVAWSELYLDLETLHAGAHPAPPSDELIDWQLETKRVHEAIDVALAQAGDASRDALSAFARQRPTALAYARFRGHGDPQLEARHLFAQWAVEQQLDGLARALRDRGQELQLDLPVGIHPEGFDVRSRPELFATGVSAGAPPDAFFSGGQVWGFPPMRPETSRADGHAYFRAVLEHQLRFARQLRIDHVMALHRLFWVPDGFDAKDGVYVSSPDQELYAAVALEAHRASARIIGEDLGTVPAAVRRDMRRHGLLRTFAGQFALDEVVDGGDLPQPPEDSIAMLETHDMPMFRAYWDDNARRRKAIARALGDDTLTDNPSAALTALTEWLGASAAPVVFAAIEDLWLEDRPQNVPGTGAEQANWRRRWARTLEDARADSGVRRVLDALHASRSRSLS